MPSNLKIRLKKKSITEAKEQDENVYEILVSFENAPAIGCVLKHMKEDAKKTLIYTIELFPRTQNSEIQKIPVAFGEKEKTAIKDIFLAEISDFSKEYTVRVNTMVNGKMLAFQDLSFGPMKKKSD